MDDVAHVCKSLDVLMLEPVALHCLHWMVLRLLSFCGVLESTSLDIDPLSCGDLGLGTHTCGSTLEPILIGSLVSLEFWVLNPHIWWFDVPWTLYGH